MSARQELGQAESKGCGQGGFFPLQHGVLYDNEIIFRLQP